MKRSKLKPGAKKKLRWIRRMAGFMQAVAYIAFLALALRDTHTLSSIVMAAIVCAGCVFSIKVYEAANELLTGYIYGGDEND